ncbi:MAG: hypothetical protein ACREC9_06650 [Methylocella sp.]
MRCRNIRTGGHNTGHGAFISRVGAVRCHRQQPPPESAAQGGRLIEAGKPSLIAIIAVARELLTILNAMLRDRKPWLAVEQELAHAKASI